MASRVTYIYRMEMGSYGRIIQIEYLYADNAKAAKEYCKDLFAERRYNYFHPVKIGETKQVKPEHVMLFTKEERQNIEAYPMKDGDFYAEHRYGVSGV